MAKLVIWRSVPNITEDPGMGQKNVLFHWQTICGNWSVCRTPLEPRWCPYYLISEVEMLKHGSIWEDGSWFSRWKIWTGFLGLDLRSWDNVPGLWEGWQLLRDCQFWLGTVSEKKDRGRNGTMDWPGAWVQLHHQVFLFFFLLITLHSLYSIIEN